MRIAVSSGHTESVVLAYAEGLPLSEHGTPVVIRTSPSSLNLHSIGNDEQKLSRNLDQALAKLREGFSPAFRQIPFGPDDRLVLSLPGVSTTQDLKTGEKCVLGSSWPTSGTPNYCIVDDTYAGLIAGALSTQGICAFAGTGASVYMGTPHGNSRVFQPIKPFKLDGYGPMFGDHGSAFRLAMRTLEEICREFDFPIIGNPPKEGRGVHGLPELFDQLVRQMKKMVRPEFTEWNFLQNWFDALMANQTPDWRFKIADLAKVITPAAEAGDSFARTMVEDAAMGMAETLGRALELEDFEDMHSVTIYCQGGMFRHSKWYLDRVAFWLHDETNGWGKKNPTKLSTFRHCVGALLVAVSQNWTVPNTDVVAAIRTALSAVVGDSRHLIFNAP